MKPSALSIPSRDMGLQPGLSALAQRLATVERRLAAVDGHPAERAVNVMGSADTVTLERQRVRDRVTDELYFKEQISQGRAHYTGTGVGAMNGNAPVVRLPAGALGTAAIMVPARALWVGTRPTVTIWYTSPVANVAVFNLRFIVFPFGAGSTTTAPLLDVFWTPPGPAAANSILASKATITAGRFWSSPFGVAKFQLARHQPGVDANPNDLDILLALVTLEEVA